MQSIPCAYSMSGSGPALFLVHGIGSRRSTWNDIVAILSEHFTCVSYDLRGHGDSPLPTSSFGLEELVEDLELLRTQLGFDQIHVAGHSLGGMIGPAYARAHPDRVLSVGLLSTAAFRTEDDAAKVQGVVSTMESKGIENTLGTLVNRWFTDEFLDNNPDKIAARIQQVMETDASVFLNVFHIYAETEMAPWLHEVQAPCLVLTGENDGGCNPRLNRQIDAALPNSQLVILEKLKHSIMIEASPLVAQHMLGFLLSISE